MIPLDNAEWTKIFVWSTLKCIEDNIQELQKNEEMEGSLDASKAHKTL